jgi:protein-disulfide isomerase
MISRSLPLLLCLALAACAPQGAPEPEMVPARQPVELDEGPQELARAAAVSLGSSEATAVVFEFSDFECPACAQFATGALQELKERYVHTGLVRWDRYDFPLTRIHPHAFLASRAARCADDQSRYWEYHDALYATQRAWREEEDAEESFLALGDALGLDGTAFRRCVRSDRHAEEVTRNLRLGQLLGVPGTPTLFVNGQRAEIRTFEDLEALLREAIGG